MEVAEPGANLHVEVAEAPHGDVEARDVAFDHAAVEDDGRVGVAPVGLEPLHDRVAAHLLLAVARDAQVDGELARGPEELRRLQEHVQLALVVDDAAAEEPTVTLDERERLGVPELERIRRLDVEVPVAEDRRRAFRAGRGADLADHERPLPPRHELCLASRAADMLRHPGRGRRDVVAVGGIGADGRDRDELRELGDERVVRREVHGRESSREETQESGCSRSARGPAYATSRTLFASASARSFFRLWCSIWRIRSRVTLNVRPTSSSVRGCWPSSP